MLHNVDFLLRLHFYDKVSGDIVCFLQKKTRNEFCENLQTKININDQFYASLNKFSFGDVTIKFISVLQFEHPERLIRLK